MTRLALLCLALTVTSCAIGMRTPAHSHPFCEGGHLVLPGDYLGQVAIPIRSGLSVVRPLLAGDTVCMKRPPAKPPEIPVFPDSAKP